MQEGQPSTTDVSTTSQPEAPWQYSDQTDVVGNSPPRQEVTWTASEFIAHHKDVSWYLGLAVGTALLALLIFLVTKDRTSVIVVVVAAFIFGAFAARQPRTLPYRIDAHGLTIGQKFYPYADLKSFSIREEGALGSIMLLPLKRFMPALTIYYPPEQEDVIITTLGSFLPHEERPPDPVDRLMHRLRF